MEKLLVCMYDKKTGKWLDVQHVPDVPTACRMVEQLTKRAGTLFNEYPEDFELYLVAKTEESDGKLVITNVVPVSLICRCVDFQKKNVENA